MKKFHSISRLSRSIRGGLTEYDRNVNTSDIKMNTVVVPKLTGAHVESSGSYDKAIVMNVMKDRNDPIECDYVLVKRTENKKRHWTLQCWSTNTRKIVPIPDTWTV